MATTLKVKNYSNDNGYTQTWWITNINYETTGSADVVDKLCNWINFKGDQWEFDWHVEIPSNCHSVIDWEKI